MLKENERGVVLTDCTDDHRNFFVIWEHLGKRVLPQTCNLKLATCSRLEELVFLTDLIEDHRKFTCNMETSPQTSSTPATCNQKPGTCLRHLQLAQFALIEFLRCVIECNVQFFFSGTRHFEHRVGENMFADAS